MALALAGNKPSLLLLLLLFSVTCSYGNQNQQFINSCGDIHNISFPFQLQGDPSITCKNSDFTLLCEDNRTVLNLFSRKYYVKSINYTGRSIRLVDVGFQSNDICSSFPPSSLTFCGVFSKSASYYCVPDTSSVASLRCENPVQSPSIYINKTGYCNSTRDNSGNGYYSYVVAGDVSIWDVADSCLLEVFYLSSSPLIRERGSNLSWLDFYKELGYGFDITWDYSIGISDDNVVDCKRCKKRASCFGHSVNVDAVCRDICHRSHGESIDVTESPGQDVEIPSVIFGSFMLLLIPIAMYWFHRQKKIERKDHLKIERFLEDYRALKPARYSYADIEKITNYFKDKVGQGGYGIVYKGQLSNDVFVAVKILNSTKGNGEDFINEVGIISTIHHVNVVRLVGYCADGFRRALIYEFLPNDSLEKFASSHHKKCLLGWKKLLEIAMGIAKGVEYLHQGCDQQILHFDIKPHNILLDDNLNPKISDFGQAKLCSKEQSVVSMTTARGTIGYIAPEMFARNFGNVSYKSGIYSFGMLLLEMVGGKKNFDEMVNSTNQIYFPEWIYNCLDGGEELGIHIQDEGDAKIAKKLAIVGLWCIQWFPIDRPSMHGVIQMLEGDGDTLTKPPNPFASTNPTLAMGQASGRPFNNELEVIIETK